LLWNIGFSPPTATDSSSLDKTPRTTTGAANQMAKFSQFINLLKLNNYHSHFAVELVLAIIMVVTVGGNLMLKANLDQATASDKSLLFAYLQENPDLNPKLHESFAMVNLRLTGNYSLEKQVLAASIKAEEAGNVESTALPTLSGVALMKPNPAGSGGLSGNRDIEVYQVQGGDTVARIASVFNVSERTILDENGLDSASIIKPGQQLRILPTTGVKHIIKDGESLDAISKKYGVDLETVLEYNEIEIEDHIFPGEEIIIPNGALPKPPTPQRQQYLADLKKEDYKRVTVPETYTGGSASSGFVWPMPAAYRLSQSFWSKHRAIDVPCRDCQVVAAADGIVEISGWQTGYGNTVLINHGNGMRTRYAHASKLLVSAGESVAQGQQIMVSGSTGRSTGPHLHFEIKKNSSYLNPMKYLVR